MGGLWRFLSRTQGGRGRLSLTDWICYLYLILGFLIIFLPVTWIGLNSVKPAFQLEKQDLSLLPSDFQRVARATVNGPEGRKIFIISTLPPWVLNWKEMSPEQRAEQDVQAILAAHSGDAFYALRAHLGQVEPQARRLIADLGLPDWIIRYRSMSATARAEKDIEAVFASLNREDERLLKAFIGLPPYRPNRLVSQILATAPDPETGEMRQWAVANLTARRTFIPGRALDDPTGTVVRLPRESVTATRSLQPAWGNYAEPLLGSAFGVNVDFAVCITNSVLVTVIATFLTLLINSMAAFALSKYRFRGRTFFLLLILATLLAPATITLVGVFKAIHATGLSGSIWGVIIPGAATPAGVFLLRQYMLTIPDELLEAARMDAASEWKIYWRIILPLALPALAALGILSIIWRWNDLILPMVATATTKEAYTIQLCLLEFRGEHLSQEHYRLAMTVVSLIPTTLAFVFLQRYITTGIANTGMK